MTHPDVIALSPAGAGGGAAPRTFQSPSGRTWAVYAFPHEIGTGALQEGGVLRFRSGDLVLELEDYPAGWQELPDAALAELARGAQPPKLRTS